MPASREIRFFPDWGHRWPLWGSALLDELTLSPSELGLSAELAADLRAWWDFWDSHLDPDPPLPATAGWDDDLNRRVWLLAGASLQARLAAELGKDFCVIASFHSYG
ncbi:hypothetical protein ACFOYW_00340 [Gryllotalpicola reticulitermitis]|uniref:Uncharacterized protein n=1 Tax=Gryllotalpicola reticulitermitis TaxID=1184153 RepID=A0ABV8Q1Z6_9MICO